MFGLLMQVTKFILIQTRKRSETMKKATNKVTSKKTPAKKPLVWKATLADKVKLLENRLTQIEEEELPKLTDCQHDIFLLTNDVSSLKSLSVKVEALELALKAPTSSEELLDEHIAKLEDKLDVEKLNVEKLKYQLEELGKSYSQEVEASDLACNLLQVAREENQILAEALLDLADKTLIDNPEEVWNF
jgi:hypothetical protein